MFIRYSLSAIAIALLLWAIFYFSLKKKLTAGPEGSTQYSRLARELGFAWAVSISSFVICGLVLVGVASGYQSRDFASDISRFFAMYGGITFLGLLLPLLWLMVRNKELESEIIQRKAKEKELETSNLNLSHAMEELRSAQRQLVESERMKALGEMASGIAHDFNNILFPMTMFLDAILQDDRKLDETTRDNLEKVLQTTKDAKEIVRRLKEFYKHKDEAPHEPVDLNQIVTSTVALTKPRWQSEERAKDHHIEVKTELAQIPPVMGNDSHIREALINLIFNAVDAMPEDGTITVRTGTRKQWATIEVTDSGTGMPEEARQRCLEPFFTTKKNGTGLGLSMVLGIMRRHGGEVEITSEMGKGTTICLEFPTGLTAMPAGEAASVSKVKFDRSIRVLSVDDDPGVKETVNRFLQAAGHTAELADTGAQAIQKQKMQAFDLIILDRALPDMSGDKLAETIKQASPNTRVIMLTGFGGVIAETPMAPKHVDLILAKPISFRELQSAIAEVMTKG